LGEEHDPAVALRVGRRPTADQAQRRILARFPTAAAGDLPGIPARAGGAHATAGGRRQIPYVDVDDTIRRTYGYAKQGAGIGYSKIKGLNALLATISTPLARPVSAACRLRKGRGQLRPRRRRFRGRSGQDGPRVRGRAACWWCGRTRRSTTSR